MDERVPEVSRALPPPRLIRTPGGARLEQDGLIVSEVLDHPGPTHTLFDVLAACVAAFAPGPRVAMLGFAAGGVVAPLRAMGFGHPLATVDLSLAGEAVFRELSTPWCGEVQVDQADAVTWLKRKRRPYDLILEDLSAEVAGELTKPPVSLEVLPHLMATHLGTRGIAITNVLPVPGQPWTRLLPHLARPFDTARVVVLDAWENRVLIAGQALPPARVLSRTLRQFLTALGSDEANGFRIETVHRPAD